MTETRSASELLRAAYQALLEGDLKERDRLCALAEEALDAEARRLRSVQPGDPVSVN